MKGEHRSIGVDLVEYAKARTLLRSGGEGLRRALSDREWNAVRRSQRPERVLACLLASKEAVFKSLPSPWMGPDNFHKIEIGLGRTSRAQYRMDPDFQRGLRARSGKLLIKRYDRYAVATCAGI